MQFTADQLEHRPLRSERGVCKEVHLNLAYRWFCRLGLDGKVPVHSTFSKNRHGRFRESNVLRHLFETVVGRCMAEGLVGADGFAVDASLIAADACPRRGNLARGLEALHPAHRAGDAHPKPFGRRIARKTTPDDGFHHSRTKITRKRHSRRLLHAAAIMNQRISDLGIPPIYFVRRPL